MNRRGFLGSFVFTLGAVTLPKGEAREYPIKIECLTSNTAVTEYCCVVSGALGQELPIPFDGRTGWLRLD